MSWPAAAITRSGANEVLRQEAEKRLRVRMAEYGVPPLPFEPIFNRLLVMRFPPEKAETTTAGGIIIPEKAQTIPFPQQCGLLVAAGNAARTTLEANGVYVGDVVYWGMYEGQEREYKDGDSTQESADPKKIMMLKDSAIMGSVDLKSRIGPELRRAFVQDPDNPDDHGDHVFQAVAA